MSQSPTVTLSLEWNSRRRRWLHDGTTSPIGIWDLNYWILSNYFYLYSMMFICILWSLFLYVLLYTMKISNCYVCTVFYVLSFVPKDDVLYNSFIYIVFEFHLFFNPINLFFKKFISPPPSRQHRSATPQNLLEGFNSSEPAGLILTR